MTLLSELKNRGCIHDVSHFEELEKLLESQKISFYCGFDPTADSLHVGHMLPLVLMRRMQKAGHKPIALLGSATGMIGDPSGKSAERNLLDEETIQANLRGIEAQLKLFLDATGPNAFKLVKNHDWLGKLNLIEFLRDTGKSISVNAMLAKDSVKNRIENREQGISYTEFSYMLLQPYDFYYLNKTQGCALQVGGSDQWGNITAGTELIRKKGEAKTECFGLTFPLLTTSSGAKFGKTAEGAVWLDAKRTSPYKFYQYWLNCTDDDTPKLLRLFTELSETEITALEQQIKAEPQKRAAQTALAKILTELIHGADETAKAITASNVLFGGSLLDVSSEALLEIFADVPSAKVAKDRFDGTTALVDLLVEAGVAQSKGAARRAIEGGGVYINNEKISDPAAVANSSHLLNNKLAVIRSGKKNYFLVEI